MITIGLMTVAFVIFFIVVNVMDNKNINGIKSKQLVTVSTGLRGGRPSRR